MSYKTMANIIIVLQQTRLNGEKSVRVVRTVKTEI